MSKKLFVKITTVQVEHLTNPSGIGVSRPRISWQIETEISGWMQVAYEIEAYHVGLNWVPQFWWIGRFPPLSPVSK